MMIKQDQPAMPAFEFSPEEPAALTPSGSPNALAAVTRQEIDLQIATAKRYPRSISAFLNACKAQATIDPEVAQSLFYSVPVGKGPNGRQAYADGPSIRMAEMVAANYRNLRFSTDIVEETDKAVTARATVMDLENNVGRSSTHAESVVGANGRRYSDRQIERIKDVAQSKALRKAIFTVVPAALVKPVITAAKQLLAGQSTSMSERKAGIVAWVKSLRIDAKRVWAALGIAGADDLTPADIEQLTALYQGIAAGETSVDDAFPPVSRFGGGESGGAAGGELFTGGAAKAPESAPAAPASDSLPEEVPLKEGAR